MENYQEGDLIICKVTDIVKTTVFVETMEGLKGSIVFSEVAPGRIRNIRVHVVPNKIIVCKILNVRENHLFLSLRRVKDKDRKEILAQYKKEKTYEVILKKLLGDSWDKIFEKITEQQTLGEFIDDARENSEILKKYFNREQIEKIKKIIEEKKGKEKEIKKEFKLNSKDPEGIIKLKELLKGIEGIVYLGNSKFLIKRKSLDLKKTDSEIKNDLESIEKSAKKQKCEFEVLKH